jgi:predicted lipase
VSQPLDKQQALFYGQFVQAAYTMYANPQSADPLRPEPSGIPAGYELGAWILMSDFVLTLTEQKFYGIVAHSVDNPDERIIAIRGTECAMEWIDDGATVPVPFHQVPSAGRVASGFDKIYSTLKVVKYNRPGVAALAVGAVTETFSGSFAEQLEQLAISREAERGIAPAVAGTRVRRPTVVTGHSLGSALATLFVMENDSKGKFDIGTLCTFASPRVGAMEFVHLFNQLPINCWRIVNLPDLVPKLPFHFPVLFDYGHVNDEYSFDSSSFAKKNLLCYHILETYLHWLDATYALRAECVP